MLDNIRARHLQEAGPDAQLDELGNVVVPLRNDADELLSFPGVGEFTPTPTGPAGQVELYNADNWHLGPLQGASRTEGVSGERFVLRSAADALAPVLPIRWLIDKTLRPGGHSIWYGAPASKKTYLLMWLAVCMALGRDWLGFKTEQTKVLWVDEESREDRLHYRFHEVLLGAGGDVKTPLWYMPPCGFKITELEDVYALRSRILQVKPGLVIIDSMAATTTGDENSKKEMQQAMENARIITDAGPHLIQIHHTPKSEENETPRGSGVFEASPDVLMRVKSSQGSPFVTLTTRKIRDADVWKRVAKCNWFTHPTDPNLSTFSMEAVEKGETAERELSPLRQWILDYLKEKGESAMPDMIGAAANTYSEIGLRKAVKVLEEDGAIRRTNAGAVSKNNPACFELSSSEDDE